MSATIEIPISKKGEDDEIVEEVVEVSLDELPEVGDMLDLLAKENSVLGTWADVALAYYKQKRMSDFLVLIGKACEKAKKEFNDDRDQAKDRMRVFDSLAAYYLIEANREKNKEQKDILFKKAAALFTDADKLIMYDQNHLLGRAYYCLLEGDKMEQADQQYNYVLHLSPNNVPSLLGKACIAYSKKDYRGALACYKKALRTNPNCPGDVRLGMAHCFLKLGNVDKAKMAFERALQLDPNCVGALVGLAILKLNLHTPESNRIAVQMLSKAYTIDATNPMVLNHLANHFFFKKDYEKVHKLAMYAFQYTENEAMRAESSYHIARGFHVLREYEQAFRYYYQSTQYAPSTFVLPHYGLGQMYIQRGDMVNAAQCFERVLEIVPGNYEAMKILGSIYANSDSQDRRDVAKKHLKKVTEQYPDDVEAWIELAQILEQDELQASLAAYRTAMKLITEGVQDEVPPEILNNVAALHYRMNDLKQCNGKLTEAIAQTKSFEEVDQKYYQSILVTLKYNMARLSEATHNYELADKLYKEILKEHPNYIDCCLRLGCIARDKGMIFVASDFFKDALQINNDNADARTLLGNLHLTKGEYAFAQKNFETILKSSETKDDAYSLIALGNFSLNAVHQPLRDKEKERKHLEKALAIYKQVIRNDPRNIWAANGIACVLAHKGYVIEARDLFAQVRESTAEFPDVWINIAHIYMEHKQHVAAIAMYENCMKKFKMHHNIELMQYLARAYVRANKLKEAKATLLEARFIAPQDTVVLFNIALVLSRLACSILKDNKSTLDVVLKAVHELEIAQKYFQYLSVHGDKTRFNIEASGVEAKQCQDLLSQAQYHVTRARRIDEEEKMLKRKHEEDRLAFEKKQEDERQKREDLERQAREALLVKRQEYMEKTKNILIMPDAAPEKPGRKGGRSGKRDEYLSGTDSGKEINEEEGAGSREPKKGRGRKRKPTAHHSDSAGEGKTKNKRSRKERKFTKKAVDNKKVGKQGLKIVSKETISSTESESEFGDNERGRARKRGRAKVSRSASRSGGGESDSASGSEGPTIRKRKRNIIESESEDRSQSRTPSRSVSRSQSRPRSASGSRSRSRSASGSRSRSRSASGSRSRSRSASGSRSRSRSASGSRSRSRSASGSRLKSRSASGSRSRSRSASGSRSRSRSASGSRSRSRSASASRSRSNSASKSRSRSGSRSSSRSRSKSKPRSGSGSPVRSPNCPKSPSCSPR